MMRNIHLNTEHGNIIQKTLVNYKCATYTYQSFAP